MSREVLFILIDVLERLKDTDDEITISEISKAIKLLEKKWEQKYHLLKK